MPGSTYSTNLKIELMTTGENSGTWGDITNTNLGTAFEQAVIGLGNPDYTSDANLTITITNSNASQAARCLVLNVTSAFGSLTATRELVVPTIEKQYIVQNNTTGGQSITVKTSAGTGITVPNGRKAHLYVNGTDVIQMFDFVDINGGTIDNAVIGGTTAAAGTFTTATATTGNITTVNATTVDATNLEVTNIKAKDGTASATIADSTGVMTIGSSVLTTTDINGGTIDNTAIGGSTAAAGAFTTLSASGAVTLSGGTANGVAYLNGSKVLTTGSGLTYDGTDFVLGSGGLLDIDGTNAATAFRVRQAAAGTGTEFGIAVTENTGVTFDSSDGGGVTARAFIWTQANSEVMRLTGTGLGIGTSSPTRKLHVNSGTTDTSVLIESTDAVSIINMKDATSTGDGISFGVNGDAFIVNSGLSTERMRIDSSGNVGIGTSSPATQLVLAGNNEALAENNTLRFWDTDTATEANQQLGKIEFFSSDASTPGASVKAYIGAFATDTTPDAYLAFATSTTIGSVTERMRIDNVGNVGIGTSSPSYKLDVSTSVNNIAGARIQNTSALSGAYSSLWLDNDSAGIKSALIKNSSTNTGNVGTNSFYMYYSDTGSSGIYNASASSITFSTNGAERARIDSSGNVLIGTTTAVSGSKLVVSAADATIYGLTVGRGAGAVATNTAVGASALAANINGTVNTAVGASALAANTTGSANIAVGRKALFTNVSGGSNVAVGEGSLELNTAGSNTALGHNASTSNTTGANNTSVGYQALLFNTTASDNTAVGYQAAYSNTTGTQNAAVGKEALKANTTGYYNNAVGAFALAANTTGNTNNAMGRLALYANTTGSSNTAIGQEALQANTTASNNTAVGYQAAYTNQTGIDTVAVGYRALYTATGIRNTAIGKEALFSLNTGTNNLAIGESAGYSMTSGSKNVIIGTFSGSGSGINITTSNNYIVLSDGDGNVEFTAKDGNSWALPGATVQTGTGITFPATQSASSNANTLDDYEEGSFTPVIAGSTTAGTGTYTNQSGWYTKIGDRVFIQLNIRWTAHTGTGNMKVTGLPFTANSSATNPVIYTVYFQNIALTASYYPLALQDQGTTEINLRQAPTGGGSVTNIPMDTSGEIEGMSGNYRVA